MRFLPHCSRRCFLGGVSAALGVDALSGSLRTEPDLKVGIVSDIHVSPPEKCKSQGAIDMFRKVLNFFKSEKVDAVLVAGDFTNGGTEAEIRVSADVWREVFGSVQGGPVKIFVTGNHEKAWANDAPACWERVWGEPWEPFFFRTVKGYAFVGAQWAEWKDIAAFRAFLSSHEGDLRNAKPFFYVQHAHPQNTCYGPWTWSQGDGGRTAEILSDYPNAVAFSGHTHYPLTDERSIWQGAFTSIATGALRWPTAPAGRENGGAMPKNIGTRMESDIWGVAQGLVMSVRGDEMVFARYDFTHMEKLGDDWIVPALHGKSDPRPYSFERRSARLPPPEFPKGACVTVAERRGKGPKGDEEDQVVVKFPTAASDGTRVYDYEVAAEIPLPDSDVVRTLCVKRVYEPNFMCARTRYTRRDLSCVFGQGEFQSLPCRFTVTPLNCFGRRGRSVCGRYRASGGVAR